MNNHQPIENYINVCKKSEVKKDASKFNGRKKRFLKIKEKATNYKGFGDRIPENSPTTQWYLIEYNRETQEEQELIEIHWIKVSEPTTENLKVIKKIMLYAGAFEAKLSPADFLACAHFGCSMSNFSSHLPKKGVTCAFLYRANYKGDRTLREPVGQCYGFGHDFDDSDILAFAFKYCEVAEIVPGHAVTLDNKRAKRLSDRDIKTAMGVIYDRFSPFVENCGFLWRIRGSSGTVRLYKNNSVTVNESSRDEAIVSSLIALLNLCEFYRTNVEVRSLKRELLALIEKVEPRLLKVCPSLSPLPQSQLSQLVLKLSEMLETLSN